jgi:hypothetical protein
VPAGRPASTGGLQNMQRSPGPPQLQSQLTALHHQLRPVWPVWRWSGHLDGGPQPPPATPAGHPAPLRHPGHPGHRPRAASADRLHHRPVTSCA